MNLEAFRKKIREYYRPTGNSQKQLAHKLGLQPTALSGKLSGKGESSLKHPEIKQIIKVLAEWEAISQKKEAVELLEMVGLNGGSFTEAEWNAPPLDKLALAPRLHETKLVSQKPGNSYNPVLPDREPAITTGPLEGTPDKPLHNLPAQVTPLVGRLKEKNEISRLLRHSDVRLVTLTGPGGVGKTRLALKLANELLDDFSGGIFFISLAATQDPLLLHTTIAHSLGIQESGNKAVLDLLKEYLYEKRLLLVLDNFEHIIAAASAVRELVELLPHLKILITSLSPLHLYGEHEYIVPPLAFPDFQSEEIKLDLAELMSFESVALFVQRAGAANNNFSLRTDNALAICKICQRLDGLPLALELAAARTKTLPVQSILERLTHRMELLNRGPGDLPYRHQNLRALIDWSYNLLNVEERELFIRLSVFAGSYNVGAVTAVCQNENDLTKDQLEGKWLDILSNLVDKSLLQVSMDERAEPRFYMLETLREYAAEKLKISGEEQLLYSRHARYFVGLAEEADSAIMGNSQKFWLDRLEIEHNNFRAVLKWLIELLSSYPTRLLLGESLIEPEFWTPNLALRLSSYLVFFWEVRGYLSEGRRWLGKILSKIERQFPEDYQMGSNNPDLSISGINLHFLSRALNGAGILAKKQNDKQAATNFLEEALLVRRVMGQPRGIALILNNLGTLVYQYGDYENALKYYEESLAIKQTLPDKRSIGLTLNNLGELHSTMKNYSKALPLFYESLTLLQEAGDSQNTALVLLNLGSQSTEQGHYFQAYSYLVESQKILGELGDKNHIAELLEKFAILANELAIPELSARLFGTAATLRHSIGAPLSFNYQARYELALESAQAKLEPSRWAEEWSLGQKMSISEAVNYSLELFSPKVVQNNDTCDLPQDSIIENEEPVSDQFTTYPGGLTGREVEVLQLAATGFTTAQIAEKLIVSPLTVQAHLRSIYNKLEITSRSAATRYAIEHKLV